jgi:hydroxymethylglutaryl-CoA lyase
MDMPFIETLDEAKHFILGPSAYAHQMSPWKTPITSWMRREAAGAAAPANGTASAALTAAQSR